MIYFCYIEDEGQDIRSFCNHLNKFSKKKPFSYQGDIYHIRSLDPSLKTEETGELDNKDIRLLQRKIKNVDELCGEILREKYNFYIFDLRIEPLMDEINVKINLIQKVKKTFFKGIKREGLSQTNSLPGIKLFNKIIQEVKGQKPNPIVAVLSHYASLKTDEMIKMGRHMASEYGDAIPIYFKGQKIGIADGYEELFDRMKEQSENCKLDPSDLTPESLKTIETILSFPAHSTLMPFVKHTADYLDLIKFKYDNNIAANILNIKIKTIEELDKCKKSWTALENERFSICEKTYSIKLNSINELKHIMSNVNIESLNDYRETLKKLDKKNIDCNGNNIIWNELSKASQNLSMKFLKPILAIKEMVRTSNNKVIKMVIEDLQKKQPDKKIQFIDNTFERKYVVFYRNSDLLSDSGNFKELLDKIIHDYCRAPVQIKMEAKTIKNNCLIGIFVESGFSVKPDELFKDKSKDDTIIAKKIVGPHIALAVRAGLSDKVRCMEFEKMPPDLSKVNLIEAVPAVKNENTLFALFFKAQKIL